MANELDKSDERAAKAINQNPPCVALDWKEDNTLAMELSGDWGRIALASSNTNVSSALLSQVAILGSHGKRVDAEATNFALGFVDAMQPKDAAEALLLSQMAAIHQATMMMARRLNHVENIPQQDAAERALNKLDRTFAAQMDTLKRYRTKGQQTVRVERVTVNEGGQAIVGDVRHGGQGHEEK